MRPAAAQIENPSTAFVPPVCADARALELKPKSLSLPRPGHRGGQQVAQVPATGRTHLTAQACWPPPAAHTGAPVGRRYGS